MIVLFSYYYRLELNRNISNYVIIMAYIISNCSLFYFKIYIIEYKYK